MDNFNLITSDWIPVRYLDGRFRRVSLNHVFREASQIADLDAAPHERISLMRLLVCITQAELGAPDSPDEWNDFGHDLASRIPAYLHKEDIFPHFNLFGDGPRFLQVPLSTTQQNPLLEFLQFKFASNSRLLDHSAGMEVDVEPGRLAINLLTFQNCFIGGGTGSPKLGGVMGNGPAIKFLNTFLVGKNLLQTILLNCFEKDACVTWGRPIWETGFEGADKWALLARLAPISCQAWLEPPRLKIRQGFEYPLEDGQGKTRQIIYRDPYSTVYVRNDQRHFLKADLARGIWKDLHIITLIKKASQQEQQAPLNLQTHAAQLSDGDVTLWAGELVKAKDAKIVDTVESAFQIPPKLFEKDGHQLYSNGISYCMDHEQRLAKAVVEYQSVFDKNFKKMERNQKEAAKTVIRYAKQHYWNLLESRKEILLDLVRHLDQQPITENFGEGQDPWTRAVQDSARDAYEKVCPRQTPRQIQAYAVGIKFLRPKSKAKNKPAKELAAV